MLGISIQIRSSSDFRFNNKVTCEKRRQSSYLYMKLLTQIRNPGVLCNIFLGKSSPCTSPYFEELVQIWHGNGLRFSRFCLGCPESKQNGILSPFEISWSDIVIWNNTEKGG